jgi:predicted PurR-regulated permease PerM
MGASILTGGSGTSLIGYAADAVFGIGLGVVVVLIATMYLLSSRPGSLTDPAVKILPVHRRDLMKQALTHLQPQLRWWAIGTSFSMTVVGVTSLIGYWIVGVDFAVPLGVFAGLTQVVPTFGPMVAFALSMTIAATQGIWVFVGVVAVYVIVQTLESYILTPMVMLKAVHIPPVITLFTVIFWGNLFGAAGLILAIPIDMTIWAIVKYQVILYRKEHSPNVQAESDDSPQASDG